MPEIRQTERFARWFEGLRDVRARTRIQARIDRLEIGNPGDVKPVGEGISEMRIDYGPGYRVYSCSVVRCSSFCSQAVTSGRRNVTLLLRVSWRATFRS
jgi:putative addiction module killer protein